MASFSVKSFERKLKEMSSRQDSVQTVSLWIIHHRAHSKTVVSLWHDCLKKAKPERRLVLFYLANDVIQNSRKKGKEFTSSFGKVLMDVMTHLRDSSIRPSVERVLKIWLERKVFNKDVVTKLIAQLNRVDTVEIKEKELKKAKQVKKEPEKPKRPVPTDFKVGKVTAAMLTLQELEAETQRRETKVSQMRLDASSSNGIKQLKDRAGGNRFSMEFEESSAKIEELVESLEEENQHRRILINLLEDSDAYYEAALNEATIIGNAYRSFGNRLHAMKKKLDNKIRKFATAEKEAPVSAPKASFLASGLSGILEEVNKSPAADTSHMDEKEVPKDEGNEKETQSENDEKENEEVGEKEEEKMDEKEEEKEDEKVVETVAETVAEEEKIVDPTVDLVEVADMDIESDSENEGEASDSAAPAIQSDTNSNTNVSGLSTPNVTPAAISPTASNGSEVQKTTNSASVVSQPAIPTSNTVSQPVAVTPSIVNQAVTSTPSSAQFGYTMTVNSADEAGALSPASHESAPSPEGSPELNLEQYEEVAESNIVSGDDINVTTNNSFLAQSDPNDAASSETVQANKESTELPSTSAGTEPSSKPPNTVSLLAQLISKSRRQNNEASGDSPMSSTHQSPSAAVGNGKPADKPLLNLIDSLFPVLSTSLKTLKETQADTEGQGQETQGESEKKVEEQSMKEDVEQETSEQSGDVSDDESTNSLQQVFIPGTQVDPRISRPTFSVTMNSQDAGHVVPGTPEAAPQHDDPQTRTNAGDEDGGETPEGDNTPEHGSEIPDIGAAAPIIIRSSAPNPGHSIPPGIHRYIGPGHLDGQIIGNHPIMDDRFYPPPERRHSPARNPNEPPVFMHGEPRRTSGDELVFNEHLPPGIGASGLRSPRIVPPQMDWDRRPAHDRHGSLERNEVMCVDPMLERRDEVHPMARPNQFRPMERMERPSQFHPVDRRDDSYPIEQGKGVHPVETREPIHPTETREPIQPLERRGPHPMERRGMIHPVDRRDAPHPLERAEDRREPLHPMVRGEGRRELPHPMNAPYPMERAVEQREPPHPIEMGEGKRGLPPPMDRREVSPHMPEGRLEVPPMERRPPPHPFERREPPCPMDRRDAPHPAERRGDYPPFERRNEFHFGMEQERLGEMHPSDFRPLERRPDICGQETGPAGDAPPEGFPKEGRERPALENTVQEMGERKGFPPMDKRGKPELTGDEFNPVDRTKDVRRLPSENKVGEEHSIAARPPIPMDRPGSFCPNDGRTMLRPIDGRDEPFPMTHCGNRPPFDGQERLPQMEFREEQRAVDVRPQFPPLDRREGPHPAERMDGYTNIHHGRGRHRFPGPQRGLNRPGPYRGPSGAGPYGRDQSPRGFRPRFFPPHAHRGPRGFGEARLKRPGPPFPPEAAKRPHIRNA